MRENWSKLTFSRTIVPFASFSLFSGILTVLPSIDQPQTSCTNLSNLAELRFSHDSSTLLSTSCTHWLTTTAMRTFMTSSKPCTSATRSAYRSSPSIVFQNSLYLALFSRLWRSDSCCTTSASDPELGGPDCFSLRTRTCGGSRDRHRLKSGDGKTVSDLTRTFVMVSSFARCGLNWYL